MMKPSRLISVLLLGLAGPVAADSLQFDVAAYQLDGQNPLDEATTQAILQPFTGPGQTVASLQEAAAALQARMLASGHGFYRVTIPPQTIDRRVRLQLLMLPVGEIQFTGQQYFSEAQLVAAFPNLQQGVTPDTRRLARNLAQFNDHPAHQAVLTLSENRVQEAIDVKVSVEDQPPATFFSSLQNTGSDTTGKWRLSTGWHTSALAGTDQQLTLSYTTSPDHHRDVSQYGASWKWPLYRWATDVMVYGGHSTVDSGTVGGIFDVAGRGDYAGLALSRHLLPLGQLKHGLKLGLDYKAYGNQVLFDQTNFGSDVTTVPLTLGWFGVWQSTGHRVEVNLDWSQNLPGGNDNDDDHHAANRSGARADWQAWRGSVSYQSTLPAQWNGVLKLQGQYSHQPLVPGEQFGVGGAQSVRGYHEREASGDQGYLLSLEAWTPQWRPGWRGVLFADGARTRRVQMPASEVAHQNLLGLGAGLRWQAGNSYGVSMDVARPMKNAAQTRAGTWRAHLLATARF